MSRGCSARLEDLLLEDLAVDPQLYKVDAGCQVLGQCPAVPACGIELAGLAGLRDLAEDIQHPPFHRAGRRQLDLQGSLPAERIRRHRPGRGEGAGAHTRCDIQLQEGGIQAEVEAVPAGDLRGQAHLGHVDDADLGLVGDDLVGAEGQVAEAEIAIGIGAGDGIDRAAEGLLEEDGEAGHGIAHRAGLVGALGDQAADEARAARIGTREGRKVVDDRDAG